MTVQRDYQRGAFVSCANTWEATRALVNGRPERAVPEGATGVFSRVNGTGLVSAKVEQ